CTAMMVAITDNDPLDVW
nr:immunoglobulin heavy chain junction region [Macaca mulatta]